MNSVSTRRTVLLFARVVLSAAIAFAHTARAAFAEPPNLGLLENEAKLYKSSGEYDHDIAAVISQAQSYLDNHLSGVDNAAVVLDIDETSLSNWNEILANDFAYFPDSYCRPSAPDACGALAWDAAGKATAILPTLELFKHAKDRRVAVFFITGRHEAERQATESNLRSAGYSGWTALYMVPDGQQPAVEQFKAAQRQLISEHYHIIINVGDQESDLIGGWADQTFKLPNPFYFIP
jgi:predicted secreted acid phosphatase